MRHLLDVHVWIALLDEAHVFHAQAVAAFLTATARCSAFVAFGKGSGHAAALHFGDVFRYALAKVRGLPPRYKGHDFSETDIDSALAA